jgi:hypothetical protein
MTTISYTLPLTTAEVSQNSLDNFTKWTYIIIALMAGTWAFFIPLGLLFVHHKWIFAENKFIGLRIWFHLHRLLMLLGSSTFFTSVILYFLYLENQMKIIRNTFNLNLATTYYWMIIALIIVTGFQICFTLLRPPQNHTSRTTWNWIHRLIGISLFFTGVSALYIGIYTMHIILGNNWIPWLVCISISLGIIVVLDIILAISYRFGHNDNKEIEHIPYYTA